MYLYFCPLPSTTGERLYKRPVLPVAYCADVAMAGSRCPTRHLFALLEDVLGIENPE